MGGYQNFLRRMNAGGKTMREEQIENAWHLVDQTFEDDPSYVVGGTIIWNTDRVIHPRIYLDKYRSTSPAQATIQMKIDENLYLGEVISWPQHGYWLCIHSTNRHEIIREGSLSFCNYIINFRSPVDGGIVSYPVSIINSTQYGSGEKTRVDEEQKIKIGTSQRIMYVTYDSCTAVIDNGFRFLVDRNPIRPTAFIVTQADKVSYSDGDNHGYIHFTIEEDQYNPKRDNKELMIADYYDDPVGTNSELVDKPELWL